MALSCTHFTVVITLAVIIAAILSPAANSQVVSPECGYEILDFLDRCAAYVAPGAPTIPPTEECCNFIWKFGVGCLCQNLNPSLKNLGETVANVSQNCGQKLSPGTNCGGYIVPINN